mgnify:CR=1 FL=1
MNSATREAYGSALIELGKTNPDVVALDADLAGSTKSAGFGKANPERFFDMGIAEADMIGTAAGLATCGKIPFASSFAVFCTGRAFDQIRNSVCNAGLNVKVVGSHAGPSCGEDGSSHQAVEDISLMRSLPYMTVVVPADDVEAYAATLAIAEHQGPCYLRVARLASPTIHDEDYVFELEKGDLLRDSQDAQLTIVACGMMVPRALEAADKLAAEGIEAQAEQSIKNVKTVLENAGSDLQHVLKTTVFLKNMDDFAKVNEVYARWFDGEVKPARSCVQAAKLPKDMPLEIEAIAVKR